MFVKILPNKSVYESLRYNEEKAEAGKAMCLDAVNFVKDTAELSRKDKLYHFERLTSLNANVIKKGIHISMNFHPQDKLSDADMVRIAEKYMNKMSFGHQPYLVYRHLDTSHPHLHVLTAKIEKDGQRLKFSRARYYLSRTIVGEIERTYGLVEKGKWRERNPSLQPAQKIQYGKMEIMAALTSVLEKVLKHYKYTTIEELNAALRLYNAEAYRGKEGSYLYDHGGLIYRVLGEDGRPTGSQIKASSFDLKPTMEYLKKQFQHNQIDQRRDMYGQHIKTAVDVELALRPLDLAGLQRGLDSRRISMVWRDGNPAGERHVYYVDHQNRTVFDGRNLGPRYTKEGLEQRCAPAPTPEQKIEAQKQINQQRQRDEPSLEL